MKRFTSTIQNNLNSVFSPRRQRILGVCSIIVLQFIVFVLMLYQFNQYFVAFYWICVAVSIVVSLRISIRRDKLAYKVAWIIPILLFPMVGGLMFLLLGGNRKPRWPKQETEAVYQEELTGTVSPAQRMEYGQDVAQQVWYLEHTAFCPAYTGNETQYFSSGEAFFPVLLEELAKAQHYIFLEYFIIAGGEMWGEILDLLIQKAAQGVEVRLIYDGMGSVSTTPSDYPQQLAAMDIHCCVFRPFRPVLSIHQNNRDHRKICVIDGVTGFVGGLNLADEYINRITRFGYWKDSALLLRGSAVWSLSVFFLTTWAYVTGEREPLSPFRPRYLPAGKPTPGFIIPYTDTPMPEDTICADLHHQMITKAKRYLYLTTPYLVIDEATVSSLRIAARSGVDVRIMTPHIPDKKVVFAVTRSTYATLLEAGVRIYEFLPGFVHSKTVVADDLYASVGSCNLDYRSFYLQLENGVWLCGDPSVLQVRDDFLQSLSRCQEVFLEDCKKIPLFSALLRSIYRLFSPLF